MSDLLISVITPVFNGENLIKDTIESVIEQTYSSVEYIVVDGNSSDGTLNIVRSYADKISQVISEPDAGMYDALIKGFTRAKGDVVCYINAGDVLLPHALQVAAEVFTNPSVSWITGYRSICNEQGAITHVDLPFRYKSSLIRAGSYAKALPFIQQESTFWRASLLKSVDYTFLRNLKMAGDYYLWWCFAKSSRLDVVSSQFGVFKKHEGQMSEVINQYISEIDKFVDKRGLPEKIAELFERLIWALHPKLRAKFENSIIEYHHSSGVWAKPPSM